MGLLLAGLASATESLRQQGYYSSYGNTEYQSYWTDAEMSYPNTTDYDSNPRGRQKVPLIIDLNNDSKNEILIAQGNYIDVFSVDSNRNLILEDEYNTGAAIQGDIAVAENQADGRKYIIAISGTGSKQLFSFIYNGSLNVENQVNITAINGTMVTVTSGIVCITPPAGYDECYFMGSVGRVYMYLPEINTTYSDSVNASYTGSLTPMSIKDYDRDGISEILIGWFPAYSASYSYVEAFEGGTLNLGTKNFRLYTYTNRPVQVMFYNVDGVGDSEILIGFVYIPSVNVESKAGILAYDSSLSLKYTHYLYSGSGDLDLWFVNMAVMSSDSPIRICAQSYSTPQDDFTRIHCFDADTDLNPYSITRTKSIGLTGDGNTRDNFVAVDTDDDGYDDLVTPGSIINPHLNTFFNLSVDVTTNGDFGTISSVSVGDVDMDGNADIIISQGGGKTYALFATPTNTIPEKVRAWGLIPYDKDSVCQGTTMQFTADRCGFEPCHYIDYPATDSERLISKCGKSSAQFSNGTFDTLNPILGCLFNSAGLQNVRVYLQDAAHKNDFSVYTDYTIIVRSGTPTIDCNLPASSEQESGESITLVTPEAGSVEETTQDMFDTITHGSSFVKIILVLAALLGTVLFLALVAKVQNPVVYVITLIMVMCLLAVIGLLAWSIIMLIGFLICLVAAIAWFAGGLGSKGGQ